MRTFIIIFFLCLSWGIPTYAGIYDKSDEYDDPPKIKSPIFAIDDETDLVSEKKIEYGKPRIVIKSVYPKLETIDEDDDETIMNFNSLILDIVKEVIDEYTNRVAEKQGIQKKLPRAKVKNSLYTDYDTSVIKSSGYRIISLRFSIQGNIAGMHHRHYHTHKVLNYNLDDNKIIELSDLFIPGSDFLYILSSYTNAQLFNRLPDKVMVANGTTPTLEHFRNWNIKANGLLITFDENEVAPRILGAQTVLVPYSVLREVIAPDSPIIDCIKNKRRCARGSVLTGGFIDEAKRATRQKIIASPRNARGGLRKLFGQKRGKRKVIQS